MKAIRNLFRVKMPRTVESTAFEIVAAVLLVAMWMMAAVLMAHGGDGDVRNNILMLAAITTAVSAFSLFRAYYPEMLGRDAKFLPKQKTALQCRLLCRMARVLAVEVPPMAMLSILAMAGHDWAYIPSVCCVFLLVVTGMYYSFMLRRAA